MSVRVRFAPSPTGRLHVGNVRTALYNWLFARGNGGSFILRIEDTDAERSERRLEDRLLDDLEWLGLNWDEGPDCGGDYGPYRQSDRHETHRRYASRLLASAKAYRCFCSAERLEEDRRQQMEKGTRPVYLGHCRDLPPEVSDQRAQEGASFVTRLRVRPGRVRFRDLVFGEIEEETSLIGDFILQRSDGSPQYNFAVVADDLDMKISHVIRGDGHLPNTHKQVLLYEALEKQPPVFAHLSTILGEDGAKLSKRHGSNSIDDLRRAGYLPQAVINYLSLLGWTPAESQGEILDPGALVEAFDLTRVHRSPATFDSAKLDWVNRKHLALADPQELAKLSESYLQEAGFLPEDVDRATADWLAGLMDAIRKYLDRLDQIPEICRVVFEFDLDSDGLDALDEETRAVLRDPGALPVFEALAQQFRQRPPFDSATFKASLKAVKDSTGLKGKALFHPIRAALTLRSSGLELDRLVPILEAGRSLALPAAIIGPLQRIEKVLNSRRP